MRQRITAIFGICAALCAQASAQNIRQSVQVSNDYETSFADYRKQSPEMSVPDSLYSFDYRFDYSVFDNPYRGSYDFSPYEIRFTPSPSPYDGHRLYLRAGAGYGFRPELTFAYTPVVRNDLIIGIYDFAGGYAGKYAATPRSFYAGGDPASGSFSGRDLSNSFGVDGRRLWAGRVLSFGACYDALSVMGLRAAGSFLNSVHGEARLTSAGADDSYFSYDLGVAYRYSSDAFKGVDGGAGESNFVIDGSVGPKPQDRYRVLIDFRFILDMLSDSRADVHWRNAGLASFTPHVATDFGTARLDAGVRIDYAEKASGGNSFTAMPHVRADVALEPDYFNLYAVLTGGQRLYDYWTLKSGNHFYIPGATDSGAAVSTDRIDVSMGVRGHYGPCLSYDVKAGCLSEGDAPLANVGGYSFVDCNRFYGSVNLLWRSERLTAEGLAEIARTGAAAGAVYGGVFEPAPYRVDFSATYNWNRRIYAGIWADAAGARRDLSGVHPSILGYCDLGLSGEYRLDRRWGAWLKLGNLLGHKVEKTPGYSIKGPYFTLGFSLNIE